MDLVICSCLHLFMFLSCNHFYLFLRQSVRSVLRETGLGKSFFGGVAQPEPLRNILRQVDNDETSSDVLLVRSHFL